MCMLYPIPKIRSVLQEIKGFTYVTAVNLNMGYYIIRFDPDAQRICTIVLPLGKCSISGLPEFFQEIMTDLLRTLEYVSVRTYIDDLLIITKDTYDDNLNKVGDVLC